MGTYVKMFGTGTVILISMEKIRINPLGMGQLTKQNPLVFTAKVWRCDPQKMEIWPWSP
jgi:hypothetical protein